MIKAEFTTRDVETPTEGASVYLKRHWLCLDYDLKQALFYGNSAQCNTDVRIHTKEQIAFVQSKIEGNVTIVFAPISYVIKSNQ